MAGLVRKNVFWPTDVAVPRRRIRALKWVPRTLPLSVPGASPQHSWRGRNKIGRLVLVGPTSARASGRTNFGAGSTEESLPARAGIVGKTILVLLL